jgi:hypothetical protein
VGIPAMSPCTRRVSQGPPSLNWWPEGPGSWEPCPPPLLQLSKAGWTFPLGLGAVDQALLVLVREGPQAEDSRALAVTSSLCPLRAPLSGQWLVF